MSDFLKLAHKKALEVREHAHAPYSQFQVGSAIKMKDSDQIFIGCNVENASFSATICAERNAIFHMIASHGKAEIEFVMVVSDTTDCFPCGSCLQVINEFASNHTKVYIGDLKGIQKEFRFRELYPFGFDASQFSE